MLITYQEGGVLAEVAVREHKEELAAVHRLGSRLERVGNTGREVPQVARADSGKEVLTVGIDRGNLSIALHRYGD